MPGTEEMDRSDRTEKRPEKNKTGKNSMFGLKLSRVEKTAMDMLRRYHRKPLSTIFGPYIREALSFEYGQMALSILYDKVFSEPTFSRKVKERLGNARFPENPVGGKRGFSGSAGAEFGGFTPSGNTDGGNTDGGNTDDGNTAANIHRKAVLAIDTIICLLEVSFKKELRALFAGVALEEREWLLYEIDKGIIMKEIGGAILSNGEMRLQSYNSLLNALRACLGIIIKHYYDVVAIGNSKAIADAWAKASFGLNTFISRRVEEWARVSRKLPLKEEVEEHPYEASDEVIEVEDVEYIKPAEYGYKAR